MYSLKIKGLALLTAIISIHAMSYGVFDAQFQVKLADLDHGSVRVARGRTRLASTGNQMQQLDPHIDKYGVPYAAKMM